jgi:hypothetical protein
VCDASPEPQLALIIAFTERQKALEALPQNHDAAMPAPPLKAQLAVLLAIRPGQAVWPSILPELVGYVVGGHS